MGKAQTKNAQMGKARMKMPKVGEEVDKAETVGAMIDGVEMGKADRDRGSKDGRSKLNICWVSDLFCEYRIHLVLKVLFLLAIWLRRICLRSPRLYRVRVHRVRLCRVSLHGSSSRARLVTVILLILHLPTVRLPNVLPPTADFSDEIVGMAGLQGSAYTITISQMGALIHCRGKPKDAEHIGLSLEVPIYRGLAQTGVY
ncbi:hypothetical protein QR685DRAFT_119095 [Neurospora intermedia]|uniref:Uncharacterized protein n=1 Tax=Neurospora intermedia TaxID=5142 RepID=A0ABR3D094_NEUIN